MATRSVGLYNQGDLIPRLTSKAQWRHNTYYTDKPSDGSAVEFDVDHFADITNVFTERHVEDQVYCTLTPYLRRILSKDDDFKNAERTFRGTAAIGDNTRSIMFMEYVMIPVTSTLMPTFGTHNVIRNATVSSGKSSMLMNRLSPVEQILDPVLGDQAISDANMAAAKIPTGTVRLDCTAAQLKTNARQSVYFWTRKGLKVCTSGYNELAMKKRIVQRMATTVYSAFPFSGILHEDVQALHLIIKPAGTVTLGTK